MPVTPKVGSSAPFFTVPVMYWSMLFRVGAVDNSDNGVRAVKRSPVPLKDPGVLCGIPLVRVIGATMERFLSCTAPIRPGENNRG
jgi:hypothetical protein